MKKLGKKVISLILALTIINSTVTSSVAISTIDFLKLNDQEITNNVSTETENQEEKSNSQNLRGGVLFTKIMQ